MRKFRNIIIRDLNRCVIHFKCTNLDNIALKQIWYMYLEYIRANRGSTNPQTLSRSAYHIKKFYLNKVYYGLEHKRANVTLKPLRPSWLAYDFFDASCFTKLQEARKQEIASWLEKYSRAYFKPLGITHLVDEFFGSV